MGNMAFKGFCDVMLRSYLSGFRWVSTSSEKSEPGSKKGNWRFQKPGEAQENMVLFLDAKSPSSLP